MHGAVGTALGGVCTIVGEPQNLLIAGVVGWDFVEFVIAMAPVTMPVFVAGVFTCFMIERFKLAGFGHQLPDSIRQIFIDYDQYESSQKTDIQKAELYVEFIVLLFLIAALAPVSYTQLTLPTTLPV